MTKSNPLVTVYITNCNYGRGSEEKVQKLQKSIEDSKEDIADTKEKRD